MFLGFPKNTMKGINGNKLHEVVVNQKQKVSVWIEILYNK